MAIKPRKKKKTLEEIEQDRILEKAEEEEVKFDWEYEEDADWSWMSPEERKKPHEVFYCRAQHPDGRIASLSGIFDPDSDYKKTIESDLARELGVKPDYAPPPEEEMDTVYGYDESLLEEAVLEETVSFLKGIWEKHGKAMEEKYPDNCYAANIGKSESKFSILSRDALSKVTVWAHGQTNLNEWTVYKIEFNRQKQKYPPGAHYLYDFDKVIHDYLPQSLIEFVTDFNKGRDIYSKNALDTQKHQRLALRDLRQKTPELVKIYDDFVRQLTTPPEEEDIPDIYGYDEDLIHLVSRTLIEEANPL
jgi:hypothetical protein